MNTEKTFYHALVFVTGLAACSLRAQGTDSATATITETGEVGSDFEYSLALDNTGTDPINAFWYGWTVGSFNLPSAPLMPAGPAGWSATVSGDSIQYQNPSGSAIAPGSIGLFTFESTSTLSQLTTGMHSGDPTGESVAYSGTTVQFNQGVAGVSSVPFVPMAVPEPSTVALMATGLLAVSFRKFASKPAA